MRRYHVRAVQTQADDDAPCGLNDQGAIVGARFVGSARRAALWTAGQCREFGTLGGSFSTAHGVNNRGEIVGTALTANDLEAHGFLASAEQLVDLNVCIDEADGWEILAALDINDRGQILCRASRDGRDWTVVLEPVVSPGLQRE